MTQLRTPGLDHLDPRVHAPTYARDEATVGIVHLGVGAFHRAHQAMYVDRLLAAGYTEWAICGVGVLPSDELIRDVLWDQAGLYTLLTVSPGGHTEARVIGSLVRHMHAPDGPEAVLQQLTDPAVRIVSLTITEGGYGINDVTGAFEPHDPGTILDLSTVDRSRPQAPRSVLGLVVEALARRRARGVVPFTVMSCDNIQANGKVARAAVTAFASQRDPVLGRWIAEHVAFPSSMVDRITPATTNEARAATAAYGIEDNWPVRSESFAQWVLEDDFPAGRPPFESVGVQLVEDVAPYELMKLRLLNASHQAMGYLGLLAGETYVHDFCRDPQFALFLRRYMVTEATPTLHEVPGIDLAAYCDELVHRFRNEAIRDTLERQVVDGSERISKFLLPVLREQLVRGGDIGCCALVLASWSRYLEGHTDGGSRSPRPTTAGRARRRGRL